MRWSAVTQVISVDTLKYLPEVLLRMQWICDGIKLPCPNTMPRPYLHAHICNQINTQTQLASASTKPNPTIISCHLQGLQSQSPPYLYQLFLRDQSENAPWLITCKSNPPTARQPIVKGNIRLNIMTIDQRTQDRLLLAADRRKRAQGGRRPFHTLSTSSLANLH